MSHTWDAENAGRKNAAQLENSAPGLEV